jgi:tetratricopeptide (TPR) repeat protein
MKKKTLLYVMAALLLALALGCGTKPLKQESVLDTADNHYSQGLRELDRGNIAKAVQEFDRAKALDPNYAEAYAGTGLALAYQKNYDKALEAVDQALGKSDKSYDARVIKGRIYTMRMKEGDDWVKDAVNEFDRAIKLNPNSDKAYFYKAEAYKFGYQFGPAAEAYSQVIAKKGEFAGRADAEYATMQKIQRAAPGTKVGMKIALIPEIDRADLAVLLLEELKLEEVYKKKKQPEYNTDFKAPTDPTKMEQPKAETLAPATDIATHWAKNWIEDIMRLGAIEAFPDHKFYPDEKITRANYAKTMEGILIAATGDQALATKYIGGQSRFPDLRSDHFSYNAVALMVDRSIMSADKITGAFNPEGKISGADALLIIRDFQNALRMTF